MFLGYLDVGDVGDVVHAHVSNLLVYELTFPRRIPVKWLMF